MNSSRMKSLLFGFLLFNLSLIGSLEGQQIDESRAITRSASPVVVKKTNPYVTADFIYYRTRQDGLDYVQTGINTKFVSNRPFQTPLDKKGKINVPGGSWDPGFKVGLGLKLDHDNWDVFLEYTWIHSHSSDRTGSSEHFFTNLANLIEFTNGLGGNEPSNLLNASSRWKLRYNVLDLSLARNFYLSEFLTINPFIGIRGTWHHQDWNSKLILVPAADDTLPTIPFTNKTDTDYWGIGGRGGIDFGWYFAKNWSLVGGANASVLWIDYESRVDAKITPFEETAILLKTKIVSDALRYVGAFNIGFKYETYMARDRYHLTLQATWDEIIWFNINYITVKPGQSFYNLSLHGLNIKFRFDF